jgi:hypothetical protein
MNHSWNSRTIAIVLIASTFNAQAQSSPQSTSSPSTPFQSAPAISVKESWNSVRELVHDEDIIVFASRNRRVHCLFSGATDDTLFCEPRHTGKGEYRFNRADVDKIRLEEGEHNIRKTVALSAIAGIAIGAATAHGSGNESAIRVAGAAVGGLAGMMVGLIIALPIAVFVPGHLVYQRPRAPHSSQASAKLRRKHDVPLPELGQ